MISKPYLLAGTMLSTFVLMQPLPVLAEPAGAPFVVAQQTKEEGKERRGGRPEGQRPARQERQERPERPERQRPAAQQQQPQPQQRPAAQQQQGQPKSFGQQQSQEKAQPQQSGRPGASSARPAAKEQQERREQRREAQEKRQERRQAQEEKQQRPERPAAQERRQERPTAQERKQEQRPTAQERKEERQEQRRDAREQKQDQPQRSFGQPQRPGVAPSSDPRRDAREERRDRRDAGDDRRDRREAGEDRRDRREAGEDRRDQREAGDDRRDRRDGDRRESVRERLDRDGPRRIEAVREGRREQRRGDRVVISEPGGRTIIRENNGRVIIRHDETRRFSAFGRVRTERRGSERVSIIARPGGVEIVSVYDDNGRLIRRVRRAGGREIVLINNRPRGRVVSDFYVRLPPPQLRIPRERYVVLAAAAAPAMIFETLTAAPVEELERRYTLEEIRYSEPVRARMPRVELNTVTFDTGAWELNPDQIDRLAVIADAINKAIDKNPQEVFMIEGHTDAVGDPVDNLSLSDRRAETVALILTEEFKVPPENLVTQGYGEQHLKIDTQAAEEQNRRVAVLRITPLLAQEGNAAAARPGNTRRQ